MIGSQTTSTIAEDSIASGGGGGGGRIFVISDKNMRSSSFDRGGTTTGKHFPQNVDCSDQERKSFLSAYCIHLAFFCILLSSETPFHNWGKCMTF